jgi:hypothetical protein
MFNTKVDECMMKKLLKLYFKFKKEGYKFRRLFLENSESWINWKELYTGVPVKKS